MQEDVTCSLGTQLAFSYDRYQMELCGQQRASSLVAIAYLSFPFNKTVVQELLKLFSSHHSHAGKSDLFFYCAKIFTSMHIIL